MTDSPRGISRTELTGQAGTGNMKVVRHDPVRERRERLILVTLFLVLGFGAYWAGGFRESGENTRLASENKRLSELQGQLLVEKEKLADRVAILERSSLVDREAANNVRTLIRELEDEKAALNKDLTFYKSIMAPEDLTDGVKLSALDLVSGTAPYQYRMRLVISQVARNNGFLRGALRVSVTGQQDGKEKTLSLLELAGLGNSPTLGFRYFQSFPESRGFLDFDLPENFQPESIRVRIQIRSGGARSLDKTFNWDEELAADVGQEQAGE